jgi:hypothetical protein
MHADRHELDEMPEPVEEAEVSVLQDVTEVLDLPDESDKMDE